MAPDEQQALNIYSELMELPGYEDKLWKKLDKLELAIRNHDREKSIQILSDLIPQWECKINH